MRTRCLVSFFCVVALLALSCDRDADRGAAPGAPATPAAAGTESAGDSAAPAAADSAATDSSSSSSAPAKVVVKNFRLPLPAGEEVVSVWSNQEGFYVLSKLNGAYHYRCFNGDGVVTMDADFSPAQ